MLAPGIFGSASGVVGDLDIGEGSVYFPETSGGARGLYQRPEGADKYFDSKELK